MESSQATVIAAGRATAIDGTPVGAAPPPDATADPGRGRLRALNGLTGFGLGSGELPGSILVTRGRPLDRGDAGTTNVLVDQSLGAPPASLHPGSTITLATG